MVKLFYFQKALCHWITIINGILQEEFKEKTDFTEEFAAKVKQQM